MADPNRPVTAYPPPPNTHAPPQPPNNTHAPPLPNNTHAPPPPNNLNGFSQPHAPPHQYHAPPPGYPPNGFSQPPPQNYPYYPHAHPYNYQRATFLRRILSIIIAAFIFTGTIVFIIWLVLRPHLPQIRVDSLSLTSPFNLTSDRLSTSWDLRLTARNPNGKITLSYEHIQAFVFYRRESLADTYLPPFVQGRKNETGIFASFAAANTYVDHHVVDEIDKERGRSNGDVGFTVVMIAEVRLNAGAWRARRRYLKAYCGDLVVSVMGNGSRGGNGLVGGPRQCRVDL